MLEVTLRGNGYGGGEIRLHSANIPALDIKHNDWIMLSAQSSLGPQFRWYRISFIDDEVQTAANGTFYRDATIQVLIGIEQNGYRRSHQIRPGLPQ